jgi:hypothetical protein
MLFKSSKELFFLQCRNKNFVLIDPKILNTLNKSKKKKNTVMYFITVEGMQVR